MMDREYKRIILLDHYNNPNNRKLVEDKRYRSVHNASESCIDDLTVYMLAEDGVIKDIQFSGIGCTISTASTDIMCDLLKNKTFEEAREILANYNNMVTEKPFDEDMLEDGGVKCPNCGTSLDFDFDGDCDCDDCDDKSDDK